MPGGIGRRLCISMYGYAQNKLSQTGGIVRGVFVDMGQRPSHRKSGKVRHYGRYHVLQHVTVKKPLSGTRWPPAHVECLALCDSLCHHCRTRFTHIVLYLPATVESVNPVIEAMQMQSVGLTGGVDPSPVHWLTYLILKALRERPGLAVDRG